MLVLRGKQLRLLRTIFIKMRNVRFVPSRQQYKVINGAYIYNYSGFNKCAVKMFRCSCKGKIRKQTAREENDNILENINRRLNAGQHFIPSCMLLAFLRVFALEIVNDSINRDIMHNYTCRCVIVLPVGGIVDLRALKSIRPMQG